ncbi:MAG TPA: helix-turn-helix transcriptional regulator [Herpetosiphonaceae bacterium]
MDPHQDATLRRLLRARAFIAAAADQPIDLALIAREASFSRYHFLRLFRDTFHQTPHQYLTERRIARAKGLLAASQLSVTEVCFEVGFQSLGSFSSLFQRCVGYPPTEYRRRIFQGVALYPRFIPACYRGAWLINPPAR